MADHFEAIASRLNVQNPVEWEKERFPYAKERQVKTQRELSNRNRIAVRQKNHLGRTSSSKKE